MRAWASPRRHVRPMRVTSWRAAIATITYSARSLACPRTASWWWKGQPRRSRNQSCAEAQTRRHAFITTTAYRRLWSSVYFDNPKPGYIVSRRLTQGRLLARLARNREPQHHAPEHAHPDLMVAAPGLPGRRDGGVPSSPSPVCGRGNRPRTRGISEIIVALGRQRATPVPPPSNDAPTAASASVQRNTPSTDAASHRHPHPVGESRDENADQRES